MPEPRDTVSEVERLLDELESYAEKSPWYLPNKVAIRDEDFFRITQRIRELLPTELTEARAMLEKRDMILRNAQEEHKRIIESAEKRLEDLIAEDRVVVAARQEAERIVQRGRVDADGLKREALEYTAGMLADLEKQFGQTIVQIKNGRELLGRQIGETAAPAAPVAAQEEG
jgi:cell division septum initiation protein DivIVA